MDEKEEQLSQLLADHRFIDWVVNPQSIYASYWLQWIAESEHHAALAAEARSFLLQLSDAAGQNDHPLPQKGVDALWQQIASSAQQEDSAALPSYMAPATGTFTKRRKGYWLAAALLIGLVTTMTFFLTGKTDTPPVIDTPNNTLSSKLVRYNGTDKNQLIFLPDGSKITLAKGGQVTYHRLMNGNTRDVELTGEAFFDVAKNPSKPFLIYTPKMVVKVLGTSFRVISGGEKEAVLVKTGKVSVFLKGQDITHDAPNIVLPKQTCTLSGPAKGLITAAYTGQANIDLATDSQKEYAFEDAPLEAVFKALENMYDLPIHYDRQAFEHCFINITLGNENLEEKLAVITQTINASYTLSDKGIKIEGTGCK
jgi:ferric-dicitrate binding protein FerR (iron transport regulator)